VLMSYHWSVIWRVNWGQKEGNAKADYYLPVRKSFD